MVANQKMVCFSEYDYSKIPLNIALTLKQNCMQMYAYLFEFAYRTGMKKNLLLSFSYYNKRFNVGRRIYTEAFNELVSLGYLVEDKKNIFTFYPDRYNVTNEEILEAVKCYIKNKYSERKPFYDYCAENPQEESYLDIYPEGSDEECKTKLGEIAYKPDDPELPF